MITSSHFRFRGSSPEANTVAAGMAAGGIPGALAAMALNKAKQQHAVAQQHPPCPMSYPQDQLRFGSGGTTVAIVNALADHRKKQQNPNYVCPVEQFNHSVNTAIANGVKSVFVPTPVAPSPIRFGGDDDDEPGDWLDKGEEAFEGWVLGKAGDVFLSAGDKNYKTLAKYKKPPASLDTGKEQLRTAKHSSDPSQYYRAAEQSFLQSVAESTPETHKSHGYRHAAIAAKLAGDSGAAVAHQKKAHATRHAAAGSWSWEDGPKKDIEHCEDETKFFANQATQPIKNAVAKVTNWTSQLAYAPFATIDWMLGIPQKEIAEQRESAGQRVEDFVKYSTSPFQKAKDDTKTALTNKFNELNGEDSDDEWIIKDSDPKAKGKSTGKGLRHKYM